MNSISIFTDGSSRGNPGPGGYGAVVVTSTNVTELGGAQKDTTNNKMELKGVIEGLKKIGNTKESIKIYTDSSYVINGITKWIQGWKRNGWITKAKDDVANKDLWIQLDQVVSGKNVSWEYVGGHIGIAGNERCDVIATSFADGEPISLYDGPLSQYSISNILDVSHSPVKAELKKKKSKTPPGKAHSYVSSLGGKIEIHHTWAECEKRVKGTKGARFKKATTAVHQTEIVKEFSQKTL
ncbi:MAG: ribonuclease HI [bacterium]|nr:ribonuclease HI [bacterium]